MSCKCSSYKPLELLRDAITERIRETRKIRRGLTLTAEYPNGQHRLYKCEICGQMWQMSRAWNWGNHLYIFQVPSIAIEEWSDEPFVQPDELLIFDSMITKFVEENNFVKTDRSCKVDGCDEFANRYSVFCLEHHIESLQRSHSLPNPPRGRLFHPFDSI